MLRTETGENNCTVMRQSRPLDSSMRQKGAVPGDFCIGGWSNGCKAAIGAPQPWPRSALQGRVLQVTTFSDGEKFLVWSSAPSAVVLRENPRHWLCPTLGASAQRGSRYLPQPSALVIASRDAFVYSRDVCIMYRTCHMIPIHRLPCNTNLPLSESNSSSAGAGVVELPHAPPYFSDRPLLPFPPRLGS